MTIEQVYNFFKDKEDAPCPITERLVGAGYQQKDGGYIKRAKKEGLEIDYTKNRPSQYWHLMTFCQIRPPQEKFSKTIQCGELIFWMAEASGSDQMPLKRWLIPLPMGPSVTTETDPSMIEGTGTKRFNASASMPSKQQLKVITLDNS